MSTPSTTEDLDAGWVDSVTVRQGTRARLPPAKWRDFREQPTKSYTETSEERASGRGQYRGDTSGNDGAWRDVRAQDAGVDNLHEFDRILDEF